MFLSKVTVKRNSKLFEQLSEKRNTNGYILHRLLWDLFPNDGDKKRDFLFHKEEKDAFPSFFVLSQEEPVSNEALSVQAKSFSPKLSVGDKLAFTLVANPVVARKIEGKKNSAKHDVWMDAKFQARKQNLSNTEIRSVCELAAKEWLIKQGKCAGFSCSAKNILVDGYMQNSFYKPKEKRIVRFSSIHYEGILTITSPDDFIKMLSKGLGRLKAFGCGLMLIKRV